MGWDSPSHWAIIALVVLVLFGYKRLPEMSRSVGRSLRIFKTEIKGMGQDDAARDAADTASRGAEQPPPVVAPPVVTPPPAAPSAVTPVVPAQPTTDEAPRQQSQA